MFYRIRNYLFPPKCVLCHKLLEKDETDLCALCRKEAPVATKTNFKFSFVADWVAVWYYKDNVRNSLLRFKFSGRRSYATVYGRFLAMVLQTKHKDDFDILTWVSTGMRRSWRRGYDHAKLIAQAVAKELGVPLVKTLKKTRHTPPQSTLKNAAQRRANVLGAYKVLDRDAVAGKKLLLIDDIITTGATASECARVLMSAGAKSVTFAAVAVANDHNKK